MAALGSRGPAVGGQRRLLLLGAGHAHLYLLHRIDRLLAQGIAVTVVDPSADLWYSGMAPAVLGGAAACAAAAIPTRRIVEAGGGRFIQQAAAAIDPSAGVVTTASGRQLHYDVLSVALGSTVAERIDLTDAGRSNAFTVKPIGDLLRLRDRCRDWPQHTALRIAVVGGGPSAFETACNVAALAAVLGRTPQNTQISIVARSQLLFSGFPRRAARLATRALQRRGVQLVLGNEARAYDGATLYLGDRSAIDADLVVLATGLVGPAVLRKSGLPVAADGGLIVDAQLQVSGHPIFGGGDCIDFAPRPLLRIGVHAVKQQKILYHNVLHALGLRSAPRRYRPGRSAMLILNSGRGRGILIKGRVAIGGYVLRRLKLGIDWNFVRTRGRSIAPTLRRIPRREF